MSEEKHPTFQGLMDQAYDRFTDHMSHKEMLSLCTPEERDAVLLGNLNYQVCNGGFRQWVDNGYGLNILDTVEALKNIQTPSAIAVIQMLQRIKPYINLKATNKGYFGNYWANATSHAYYADSEEEEDGDDGVPFFLDEMDSEFYDLNEGLLDEIEAYFKS